MKAWIHSFFTLIFPRYCVVCHSSLSYAEECICTTCNIKMPRTDFHLQKDNLAEKQLWGLMPIERATAYFHYQKESNYRRIIHDLKYKGYKQIGEVMGRYMASELHDKGFFKDIDLIIPVPLHKNKLRKRGYNQSEYLARGIAQITHIQMNTTCLIRKIDTDTQTTRSRFHRWQNMDNVFELRNPQELTARHILLVDDVLTTGATFVACSLAFADIKEMRFSILALGMSY